MKKFLSCMLIGIMTLSLASCGSESDSNEVIDTQEGIEVEASGEEQADEAEEPVELSDDLWSYEFLVNGKLYKVPMWFSELEELGWEYRPIGDTILSLDSNRTTQDPNMWKMGDSSLFTTFYNMGINTVPYTECGIVEIDMDKQYLKEGEWEVILPAGIQFGVSTKEDIIAAYGEPDYDSDIGDYDMFYDNGISHNIRLTLESIDGTLCGFSMMNLEKLEGADNTVSTEVPETVKNYKAPEALGDSIEGTDIELNGHLYSLPFPVAEFVANGFELQSEYSGITVPSGESEYVVFDYNGQLMSTMVTNYSPNATTTDNCFVKEIEIGRDMDLYEWTIAGGVKKGSTESDVIALLDGYEYEMDEIGDSYKSYKVEYYINYEREYYSIGLTDGVVSNVQVISGAKPEY